MSTYYLLDLDRCLLNTGALHMVFDEIMRSSGTLDVNDIIRAKQIVEETSGGSFDTAEFVQAELARHNQSEKWPQIEQEFIVASKDYDYLMPGAKELLELLRQKNAHFGIITYGGDVWQRVKIRAAGLASIPHTVTAEKRKGTLIAQWQQDGCVPNDLGCIKFDEVVLIDDKVVSFTGYPQQGARGFQVRTGVDLLVEPSMLPPNVTSVENLYSVIEAIK